VVPETLVEVWKLIGILAAVYFYHELPFQTTVLRRGSCRRYGDVKIREKQTGAKRPLTKNAAGDSESHFSDWIWRKSKMTWRGRSGCDAVAERRDGVVGSQAKKRVENSIDESEVDRAPKQRHNDLDRNSVGRLLEDGTIEYRRHFEMLARRIIAEDQRQCGVHEVGGMSGRRCS
jgi:hypothetical protein